ELHEPLGLSVPKPGRRRRERVEPRHQQARRAFGSCLVGHESASSSAGRTFLRSSRGATYGARHETGPEGARLREPGPDGCRPVPGTRRVPQGHVYGTLRRAHTLASRRSTSGCSSDAPKLSEPAAKTFAPEGVS